MEPSQLKQLEFELAFLTMLTKNGLKPLSRWEKSLLPDEVAVLEASGLSVAHVSRRVRNGSTVTESVFSSMDKYIDLYVNKFEGTPVDKSPVTQRFEGFLFGFPPCCVEHFIQHGYAQNNLSRWDQELLFHWACPGCQVTPTLVPEYRRIYQQCQNIFAGKKQRSIKDWHEPVKKTIAVSASLSLLALGIFQPVFSQNGSPLDADPHWLDCPDDADNDYLEDTYEKIIGLNPGKPDTDGNGVVDGVQLARELEQLYQSLPDKPRDNGPFVQDHMLKGIETCSVCKETVNMGYAVIINPLENLFIKVPYISLHHFLRHGSFSYDGDIHGDGRINAALLFTVLTGDGSTHRLPIDNDQDNDGLADDEEPFFGTDKNNPDSDNDGREDGVQLARAFAARIDSLSREPQQTAPYAIEHKARGIEMCPHCGQYFNMGFVELIHPQRTDSLSVPFIAVHYLHCGCFKYHGTTNKGIIEPHRLRAILSPASDLHHINVIPDRDHDGLSDSEENRLHFDPDDNDQDNDGIKDGVGLAKKWAMIIQGLPEHSESGPFVVHHPQWGLETCHICGEEVNMGFVDIGHPQINTVLQLPYLGLHFMEHGSFSYYGTVHQNRVNVAALHTLLTGAPTTIREEPAASPNTLQVQNAYPNPFNSQIVLPFVIHSDKIEKVQISIYNIQGKCVRTLLNRNVPSGRYEITWDGRTDENQIAPSALYFIEFKVGETLVTRKITFIK